ncbi:nucleotidyltransferase domain-containing protein [Klebsiella pneumoniae]|uniref:nucleotidyltransferase domain-containing protein n=1 Tax=Klebsiella pneumoniae TaxID=573 RepID=UPI001161F99B|nr:nucleotidyltransferase domain-containing protein [Klebsiella pneumoniae]QDP35132.1 nucleotidyltransferase domain-containing protein [Klebsiella pneumoniae]TRY46550.1 nucleotidyltransferase domain-containing protein [Klebsiella pneumoniae]
MIELIKNDSLDCLVLFGSHATNEADEDSDIDLLGINNSTLRTVRENGKVNLSLYSLTELKQMARSGNIFILHVILEGVCVFNPKVFDELKNEFQYKENYNIDIATAFYLANVILNEKDNISNWAVANKRISWCVRTILISISVENRKPVFSKRKLAMLCLSAGLSYEDSYLLVDAKSNKEKNDNILNCLSFFLDYYKNYNEEIVKNIFSSGIVVATLDSILNSSNFYDS